jgi:hypothetical protein
MATNHKKLPYPVKDETEFDTFLEAYEEKRTRNINRNLEQGTLLITKGFSKFGFLTSPGYEIPPGGQPVAYSSTATLVQRAKASCAPSIRAFDTKIALVQRITPELGCKSQVWTAHVNGNPECVAVKIYQECLVDNEPWWLPVTNELMGFWPEEEQSHREAWAYYVLAGLQGSIIPHSYGFYNVSFGHSTLRRTYDDADVQVTLPSGDEACVHILEHFARETFDVHIKKLEANFGPRINPSPFKSLVSNDSIYTCFANGDCLTCLSYQDVGRNASHRRNPACWSTPKRYHR